MASSTDIYDLLILVDATYSMSDYLTSLRTSIPRIVSISALTNCFSRIGLLAYRDYKQDDLIQWVGWQRPRKDEPCENELSHDDLASASKHILPNGGGDYPEAAKTGLAKAYQEMREDAITIILLYADAPPHTTANGTNFANDNHILEQKALMEPSSYGGYGADFADWVHGGRTLALKEKGRKRAQVFSILEPCMKRADGDYYTFLSTITGGTCLYLRKDTPKDIAQVTVDLLLAWMGIEQAGVTVDNMEAYLARFKNTTGIEHVKKEASKKAKPKSVSSASSNTEELRVDSTILRKFMPKRGIPVQDFAAQYKSDDSYKKIVVEQLQKIIEDDVAALSLNPVFGSLWRAVCNDRENPARDALITLFSLQVDRITNAEERERMKTWLAESYDYTAEVQEAIDSVQYSEQFPCVYLDPTITFIGTSTLEDAHENEDDRPITDFGRDELLELGRSCDYKILKRLSRVLTRLAFVDSADQLPGHIAKAEDGVVARIPLALASQEHGRKFWRVLLHIVVPGTMLSARPAAVLAALSIKLGIQPLLKSAYSEMRIWRSRWHNLEVPENWNVSCLSLLLDADKACTLQIRAETDSKMKHILAPDDRQLFERLISYKMLELNLRTTLVAKIGWKPEKTTMPIGPLVLCRLCQYPRSVTVMGAKNICGNCLATDYPNDAQRQERINGRVSKDVTETSDAAWVECCTRTCRAQYIVYHPEALNVRAKCYYCRQQSSLPDEKRSNDPAPAVECVQCLNRVIYPHEYRPKTLQTSQFRCLACMFGRKTVVDVHATAAQLSKENGTAWLLTNKDNKLKAPFSGQSLFQQVTQAGTKDFCNQVILFPETGRQSLLLNGQILHNTSELIDQLREWISRRHAEQGTCSLCFSNLRKSDINPACGRHGCDQGICRSCLAGWYGLNAAGKIINISALSCPFCRRAPTAKTLHAYGMGINAVCNLQEGVEKKGQWIYAWCKDCTTAKPYLERVCARGAPPGITDWICEECQLAATEAARRQADWIAAETARMEREGRHMHRETRMALQREAGERASKLMSVTKECPHCSVQTEKSMGCGHMTCVCGKHWCWFCGEKQNEDGVYDHMSEVHGGWYGNDIDEGDD
ncbi:hypothetical protein E2P81_ATG06831 [Venturia nashicola]|uniref:RING-type domain-containing protein n=1 Tax=Venturia nashicola TaxID=86259 RepID=A0A4Z1NY29_9PEZI|nr:hypothetical protein E6O75_ATG07003 [Venturia nashicola]TLD30178.1 hypothetical protein E2P81_ATG06831 [Venturia nashicola]